MFKVSAVLASSESCLPALQEPLPIVSLHGFFLCAHAPTHRHIHVVVFNIHNSAHAHRN